MPSRTLSAPTRKNVILGWGLGLLALSLYAAITWRWTLGF